MRKIINSTYITLDGAIENPQDWPSGKHADDGAGGALQVDLLRSCDALLMGRHTYDGFAPVWPTRSGDPYSDQINSMQKYVVSSTLRDPEWNNTTVIDADPIAEIARLKEQPGKDIVQYGFGRLSYALMENGLLDELRLWVHPFFVGRSAEDLMFRETTLSTFDLVGAQPLTSGIVVLSYRAAQ
ncbi:dihydrofolate reductase family protein [Pseudonocardia sp. TRM90224]|uniref:dihydrofolate reductase family protein n=1 Tax=Pseudonocardia sp. TRM90224 TaxID=2812678 RepID=UPI001E2905D2|nr:dihydrofolate reductase family protein [Pseudonocardia sp. TRM90224]